MPDEVEGIHLSPDRLDRINAILDEIDHDLTVMEESAARMDDLLSRLPERRPVHG